jgi:hypothetical protein
MSCFGPGVLPKKKRSSPRLLTRQGVIISHLLRETMSSNKPQLAGVVDAKATYAALVPNTHCFSITYVKCGKLSGQKPGPKEYRTQYF